MLRRVGWKHGQQLYQLTLLTGNAHNKFRLLHQSSSCQCPSTAAQLRTVSSEEPASKNLHPNQPQNTQQDGSEEREGSRPPRFISTSILHLATSVLASGASLDVLALQVRSSRTLRDQFLDRQNLRYLAEALAQSPFPQLSLKAFTLAHHMGCMPRMHAYECVALQLAQAREWAWLRRVSALAKKHLGRTTVRLLNWRLRSLIRTENFAELDTALAVFADEKLTPNRLTFHLLLTGHLCNHNLAKAKGVMQTMEAAGVPVDASTTAAITTVYRSLGLHRDIERNTLSQLDQLSSSVATTVLNSMIQLRLDAHDQRGALHLLSRFSPSRVHPLIQVLSSDPSTLPTNDGSHLLPNDVTYSLFIAQMIHTRDVTCAHQIMSVMLEAGIPITPTVIASLIHVYSANGDISTPIRLVHGMYDVPAELWAPFSECLDGPSSSLVIAKTHPDVRVFNALLKAVLRWRSFKDIPAVLKIMASTGVLPNNATADMILSHLDEKERVNPSVLARTLKKLLGDSNRPSIHHMHIILRSFLRHEKYAVHGAGWDSKAARFSKTRSIHARAIGKPLTTIVKPFDPTAGLNASPQDNKLHPLLQPLRDSLAARHVRSSGATMALRVRRDAVNKGDLEGAREVVETLLARGITPNEYHFSALMEGHAQLGDMQGALDIFDLAMRSGIKPNVVLYTILIAGFAQHGQPREALRAFRRLIKSGVKPDVPAIDAVSSAFFIVGSYGMARRVLLSLWSLVGTPPKDADTTPLRELAKNFRSLHLPNGGKEERQLSPGEQEALERRIKRLFRAWPSCHVDGSSRAVG